MQVAVHPAGTCHENTTWHGLVPRLLAEHQAKRVAEIGVWRGSLSGKILEKCPLIEHLILVDSWTPIYGTDPIRGVLVFGPGTDQAEMDDAERTVRTRFAHDSRVTVMKLASRDGAKLVPDGSLDAVLIDALHFENAVMDDIRAWYPKLRRGGVMMGDDMSEYYPGVQMGVEKVFGDQYRAVGQTWWTTKEAVCSMESVTR